MNFSSDFKNSNLKLLESFFVVLASIVVFNVHVIGAWRPKESPRIGMHRWITVEGDDAGVWQRDFDNLTEGAVKVSEHGNTYLFSSHITAVSFDCNASYPVKWVFHHSQHAGVQLYNVRIRTSRTASDIWNERTNQFSSHLELYGDTNSITGSYSCMSADDEQLNKTIYIYWQGSSPPYLVLAGEETVTVRSKDSNTIELPCRISQPDIEVALFKETSSMNFERVESPFVKFDPKIGFIINMRQYNNTYGRYKCTTDESEINVSINVEKGLEPEEKFNETMSGNATIYYSKSEEGIICCSNSSKPPNLQEVFCFDPVSCKMKEFLLYKVGNNARHFKNGSCSFEKIYPRDSGILRCKGEGVDVFRSFYTDMVPHALSFSARTNTTFNVYFNWADIKKENMLLLTMAAKTPIYNQQNLTFACDTSYFYFSEGLKWAIRWNNGSLLFQDGLNLEIYLWPSDPKDPDFGDIRSQSAFQNLRIRLEKNMTEVLCFAPVWNTTEWVNKTLVLNVQESFSPRFDGPTVEVMTLTLNETEKLITCRAVGKPTPTLKWRKNNKTIGNENNMVVKRYKNGTATLLIHRVSHDNHGEYKCLATNLAGRTEKVIRIYIEDTNSSMGVVPIIFLVLLLLFVGTGSAFLMWKMNMQKKIIDHLTGVVFRDVNSTPPTENHTQTQITVT